MGHTAVLLIGVEGAGDLTRLQAVPKALKRMTKWARSQTPDEYIRVITDADDKPVRAGDLSDATDELLAMPEIDKLVIYFCGHGIVVGTDEFWLLSRAPTWGSEAVNVVGTAKAGQSLQIPHVVLISDACRLLTTDIQGAAVSGTVILPTQGRAGPRAKVDKLFACALGAAAYEVPTEDKTGYAAVYTEVLASALRGKPTLFVDRTKPLDGPVVRTRALEDHLPARLLDLLTKLKVPIDVDQQPDAELLSGADAWLSKLSDDGEDALPASEPAAALPRTVGGVARAELGAAIGLVESDDPADAAYIDAVAVTQSPTISLTAELIAPDNYLSRYGLKYWAGFADRVIGGLHGASGGPIETALGFGDHASAELELEGLALLQFVGVPPRLLKVQGRDEETPLVITSIAADGAKVASVLVEAGKSWWPTPGLVKLADGGVFILPITSGAVTRIDASEGALHSISYALSARSSGDTVTDAILRDAVAAASARGVFHPAEEDLERLITAMRIQKDVDPSLALYVAYALSDRGRLEEISDMRYLLKQSTGYDFFDLAMLDETGRVMRAPDRTRPDLPVPPYPLLAQGWPLLPVLAKADGFERMRADLMPLRRKGLWTSFTAEGWDLLEGVVA